MWRGGGSCETRMDGSNTQCHNVQLYASPGCATTTCRPASCPRSTRARTNSTCHLTAVRSSSSTGCCSRSTTATPASRMTKLLCIVSWARCVKKRHKREEAKLPPFSPSSGLLQPQGLLQPPGVHRSNCIRRRPAQMSSAGLKHAVSFSRRQSRPSGPGSSGSSGGSGGSASSWSNTTTASRQSGLVTPL